MITFLKADTSSECCSHKLIEKISELSINSKRESSPRDQKSEFAEYHVWSLSKTKKIDSLNKENYFESLECLSMRPWMIIGQKERIFEKHEKLMIFNRNNLPLTEDPGSSDQICCVLETKRKGLEIFHELIRKLRCDEILKEFPRFIGCSIQELVHRTFSQVKLEIWFGSTEQLKQSPEKLCSPLERFSAVELFKRFDIHNVLGNPERSRIRKKKENILRNSNAIIPYLRNGFLRLRIQNSSHWESKLSWPSEIPLSNREFFQFAYDHQIHSFNWSSFRGSSSLFQR